MYYEENIGKKSWLINRYGPKTLCEIIDVVITDYKKETFYKVKDCDSVITSLRRNSELEIIRG